MALIDPAFRRRDARHEGRGKQHTWSPPAVMTLPVPTSIPTSLPTDDEPSDDEHDTETTILTVTVTAQSPHPTYLTTGPKPWTKYGPNGYPIYGKPSLTTVPTSGQPQSTDSWAPSTTNSSANPSSSASPLPARRGPPPAVKAAAGVVAVLMFCAGGILLFLFLRKRKRQRHQQSVTQVQSEQTKAHNSRPLFAPSYTPGPAPAGTGGPVALAPVANPTSQPVILGPIVPDANGAYNTGIDTSDMVSLHDHIGIENPFADPVYHNDEPPPPYRPRSVAPLSRHVSLRESPAAGSGRRENTRSPFNDEVNS